jgi:hypothetical protein
MSDKRISQLVERVTIANNDVLPIVALNAATTNKVTISTIQDWMQTNMDLGVTSISVNTSTSGSDITISGSPITSTGTITINIPTASATKRGALSSADWSTFNGKQDVLTFYSPLQKNGVSVTIDQADTDTNGYLSFTDWNTFNNKEGALTKGNLTESISGVLTITGGTAAVIGTGTSIEVKQASGSQDGFLDSADWTTFNNKVSTSRSISTTAPLQGGGDLSANRTLSITQSGSASNGYLSSTDWNTFNNKQNALSGTGVVKSTAGTISYINGVATQYIDGTGSLQTFPSIIGTANNLTREVYNETGATLVKGTVIYINGGHGNLPTIAKALATSDSTSAQTYGVVQNDISDQSNGYIVVIGDLFDMPTSGYLEGTQLYLSGTTAGEFTSTKQYAPIHLVYVGIVTRSHPTQGVIAVKIQNGYEMDELHDVSAQNPSNNDILQFKTATNLWTKVAGSTTNIAEGTNLYYTDARSRGAFSESVTGLDYNSTTGVLSTTAGYGIPTTASQTNWDAAYNDKINSAAVTGTTTKTLTLTQQDGGTITASWTDINTDAVSSVFGRTGAVVAVSGDYTTAQVTESGNLYFTNGRARSAISLTTTGSSGASVYSDVTGILNVPTYTLAGLGGEPTITAGTSLQYWRGDKVWASLNTSNVPELTNLYYTDARARAAITLTTTGTSGAATYSAGVLNIPQYQSVLTNPVTGTGSTHKVAKFSGASTIIDSYITDQAGTATTISKDGTTINAPILQIYPATGTRASILNLDNSGAGSFFLGRQNSAGSSDLISGTGAYASVIGGTGGQSLHLVTASVSRLEISGTGAATFSGTITATNFSGTSSGTNTGDQTLSGLGGVPTSRTLTINGTAYDLTADRSWTISSAGSGTATFLPVWNTGGTTLGDSRISQPDADNIRFNHGGTYSLGVKFTKGGTFLSELHIGRTDTGAGSNASIIYDIAGSEIFELRRNYAASTFKISLGSTAHLTINGTGAATFNSSVAVGTRIELNGMTIGYWDSATNRIESGSRPLLITSYSQPIYIGQSGSANLTIATTGAATFTNSVTAASFVKSGGTSSQYLMADGSVTTGTSGAYLPLSGGTMTGQITWSSGVAAISFQQGGNSGTYTQTTIYANQNNTSGDFNNGIFIERGYTDTSNTEVRHFVIGARGGSVQWKMNGSGYTTQYNTCEVKPSADADLFVGRFSNGSAKLFRAYQSGSDGYLELSTGAGDIVTKLSGYGGVSNYTTTNFGFGKTSGISYKIDAFNNGGQVAAFTTYQSGASTGQCAQFINGHPTGYSSFIYIGSAPGTDWKIGKNISNPTGATYNFEIVDSSGNLRMQIAQATGNVTFSADVIAYSDIRLKKNIRDIDNALERVMKTRGVIYDRVDTDEKNTFGFIAQELEEIFPELVTTNQNGIKGVKYQNAVAVLFEAVKEQQKQIDGLKKQVV